MSETNVRVLRQLIDTHLAGMSAIEANHKQTMDNLNRALKPLIERQAKELLGFRHGVSVGDAVIGHRPEIDGEPAAAWQGVIHSVTLNRWDSDDLYIMIRPDHEPFMVFSIVLGDESATVIWPADSNDVPDDVKRLVTESM